MTAGEYVLPPRAAQAARWVEAGRKIREIVGSLVLSGWTLEEVEGVARDALDACSAVHAAQITGGRSTAKRDREMETLLLVAERAVRELVSVESRWLVSGEVELPAARGEVH